MPDLPPSPAKATDGASLAAFRILFGCLMCWSTVRYLMSGKVAAYYVDPAFHFKYYGFEWVHALPEPALIALFVAMAVLAAMIAVGLWFRLCAALFCVAFTYVFLLEQARYLNHHYLICLVSGLLIFTPAHRLWSLDARKRDWSPWIPGWPVWLLRAQIGLVYFYAGVAKINRDWLHGEPMRDWLADRADMAVLGPLFTSEWTAMTASYGALLLDLCIAPLLLWRRTRLWAFGAAVAFHLANALLFQIGVFPWMMIAATTLFFAPDWPRRVLGLPAAGEPPASPPRARVSTRALVAGYLLVQVLLPVRHFLYPGYVSWTEEGHMFAWHMKLRGKSSRLMLIARDPADGRLWRIDPQDELTDWQLQKMSGRPDMILQYVHHVAARLEGSEGTAIEVRADATSSLNSRPAQRLIDPDVDLARQRRSLAPQPWILPLRER